MQEDKKVLSDVISGHLFFKIFQGHAPSPPNFLLLPPPLSFDMAVIPAKVSLKTEGTKCIGHFCCSKNLLMQGVYSHIKTFY